MATRALNLGCTQMNRHPTQVHETRKLMHVHSYILAQLAPRYSRIAVNADLE